MAARWVGGEGEPGGGGAEDGDDCLVRRRRAAPDAQVCLAGWWRVHGLVLVSCLRVTPSSALLSPPPGMQMTSRSKDILGHTHTRSRMIPRVTSQMHT